MEKTCPLKKCCAPKTEGAEKKTCPLAHPWLALFCVLACVALIALCVKKTLDAYERAGVDWKTGKKLEG
ncbi:MAG: hypothetical protein IK095_00960 [Oscillospiraceae bacterium]|nr:hypothetical protein [Oscillospiraceae bacterium]